MQINVPLTNWKTTLAGLISGGFVLVPQIATVITSNTTGNKVNWTNVGLGIGLIIFGAIAKDHNVTGGSVPQNGGTISAGVVTPEAQVALNATKSSVVNKP